MKNIFKVFLLCWSFCFTTSCTFDKHPEFIEVKEIKIKDFKFDKIRVEAKGVFKNPNHVGGLVSLENLELYIEGLKLGKINSKKFDVPVNSDFTVPIIAEFDLQKVFREMSIDGGIKKLFQLAKQKDMLVRVQGNIYYHLGEYKYDYPIDHTERVPLVIKR